MRRGLALLLVLSGLLLLSQFSSPRGQLVAGWMALGGLLLLRLPSRLWGALWAAGWLGQVLLAPSSQAGCSGDGWLRLSPFNLVPESDWSDLGINLIYANQASRIKALSRPYYASTSDVPHTLHYTVSDLLGLGTGSGHLYFYAPPGPPRPLLMFLHGAMGNLQCYLNFWQESGYAVVCPTFGFGFWYRPGGMETAADAWTYAQRNLNVQAGPATWVGHSNGATGAVRVTLTHPEMVDQLVLISPVLEPEKVGSAEFARALHNPPLILEGDQDRNVSPASVERGVAAMRAAGVMPSYRLLAGHDHFLLFSARTEVYQAVGNPGR